MTPAENSGSESIWPPGGDPTENPLKIRCTTCDRLWLVHPEMAGFRIRCECNEWVQAPAKPETQTEVFMPILDSESTRSVAQVEEPRPIDTYVDQSDGTHWDYKQKSSWTNRTLLQIVAILCCFYLPQIALAMLAPPDKVTILSPIASLASCILIFLVALLSPRAAFKGLVWPGWRPFGEAAIATVMFLGLAYLLIQWINSAYPDAPDPVGHMRQVLGLGVSLLTISLAPGIFEELAFRGILQERMVRFFGRHQGILLTGIAFGLAHGIGVGLPIQMGIGLYLCWLRDRCGSLLPGIALHMVYNGTLVYFSS